MPAARNPSGDASRRPRLLIVDDDEFVLRLLGDFLAQRGYRVATAPGGAEALVVASSLDGGIDLLITDLKMPGMTGIELARRFTVEKPGVPILFVSGEADCCSRVRAASIDARTEVLTKPLDLKRLELYIAAAIRWDQEAARS